MLSIFIFTINAILPVITVMLLGYFLKSIGMFTKEFLKVANKVVFYVCLPVLLFKNLLDVEKLSDINWTVIIYVVIVILIIFAIGLFITLFIEDRTDKGVVLQCVFRSNFAMIGVALADLIAGSDGVISAAIISAFSIPIFNVLSVVSLTVFDKNNKLNAREQILPIFKKILKNPLIIGILAGLIALMFKPTFLSITSEELREGFSFIDTSLGYIARVASPLSLLVLGGQFDFNRVAGYKKQIIISTLSRNVMAPVLGLGVAVLLHKSGIVNFNAGVFASLVALFGTPVAVASAIMAEEMGSNGELAGQLVVWTTVLSAFSMFIIVFCLRLIGVI